MQQFFMSKAGILWYKTRAMEEQLKEHLGAINGLKTELMEKFQNEVNNLKEKMDKNQKRMGRTLEEMFLLIERRRI